MDSGSGLFYCCPATGCNRKYKTRGKIVQHIKIHPRITEDQIREPTSIAGGGRNGKKEKNSQPQNFNSVVYDQDNFFNSCISSNSVNVHDEFESPGVSRGPRRLGRSRGSRDSGVSEDSRCYGGSRGPRGPIGPMGCTDSDSIDCLVSCMEISRVRMPDVIYPRTKPIKEKKKEEPNPDEIMKDEVSEETKQLQNEIEKKYQKILEQISTNMDKEEESQRLGQPEESEMCLICFEAKQDTAVIPCGHKKFCHDCITDYASNFSHRGCPVCRSAIVMVTKIY